MRVCSIPRLSPPVIPSSSRSIYTNSKHGPSLNLHSKSPLIRPHLPSAPTSSSSASPVEATAKTDDFIFWPNFFSQAECRTLVEMALWKLDRVDSSLKRRRKSKHSNNVEVQEKGDGVQHLFNREYGFEEGHYDSVIHQYRETLLSTLPPSPSSHLINTLSKLYSLLPNISRSKLNTDEGGSIPPKGTITHLLHLAPEGQILPHVDNLEASGSYICGVSLGAERTLRLKKKDDTEGDGEGWDVRLGSGSVYLQRDTIRYNYEHSILPYTSEGSIWDGERLRAGHRISIMIRDTPSKPAKL